MAKLTPTGGVKPGVGGYNYSTDRSQNVLFNQGETVGAPGASDNSYDYSAKGRADRMYKSTGNSPAPVPASYDYGTAARKAAKIRRVTRALNS